MTAGKPDPHLARLLPSCSARDSWALCSPFPTPSPDPLTVLRAGSCHSAHNGGLRAGAAVHGAVWTGESLFSSRGILPSLVPCLLSSVLAGGLPLPRKSSRQPGLGLGCSRSGFCSSGSYSPRGRRNSGSSCCGGDTQGVYEGLSKWKRLHGSGWEAALKALSGV